VGQVPGPVRVPAGQAEARGSSSVGHAALTVDPEDQGVGYAEGVCGERECVWRESVCV